MKYISFIFAICCAIVDSVSSMSVVEFWKAYVNDECMKECTKDEDFSAYSSVINTLRCSFSLFNKKECPKDVAYNVLVRSLGEVTLLEEKGEIKNLFKDISRLDLQNFIKLDEFEKTFVSIIKTENQDLQQQKIEVLSKKFSIDYSLGICLFVESLWPDEFKSEDGAYQRAILARSKLKEYLDGILK